MEIRNFSKKRRKNGKLGDLTCTKNGNRMSTKGERGGLHGKNLFGQKDAKDPAGFAYTCSGIIHSIVKMFNTTV
jgi:hypothetical protein